MKIVFSPRFVREFVKIADYYKNLNPSAAERISIEIESAVELLFNFPHLGQPTRQRKTRRFVTTEYGYLIYYTTSADIIEFVALTHGRQKRPFKEV